MTLFSLLLTAPALVLDGSISRRQLATAAAAAVGTLPFAPLRVLAADDDGGFDGYKDRPDYPEATAAQVSALDDAAAKRAEFKKREAAYRKAWRREISNLEFAANDEEFIDAVRNLLTMIEQFGGDTLPNGKGSKVELEQVYVIQKDKLGKNARMAFLQLDSKATQLASPKREGIED